jgi:hypothetical protein
MLRFNGIIASIKGNREWAEEKFQVAEHTRKEDYRMTTDRITDNMNDVKGTFSKLESSQAKKYKEI